MTNITMWTVTFILLHFLATKKIWDRGNDVLVCVCVCVYVYRRICSGSWRPDMGVGLEHTWLTYCRLQCETGQVCWWQCAAPLLPHLSALAVVRMQFPAWGEVRRTVGQRWGGGMQRTSKASESYQKLERCQRYMPACQPYLTPWCTRTSAMTVHTLTKWQCLL